MHNFDPMRALFSEFIPSLPFRPISVDENLDDNEVFNRRYQTLFHNQETINRTLYSVISKNADYILDYTSAYSSVYYTDSVLISNIETFKNTEFFFNTAVPSNLAIGDYICLPFYSIKGIDPNDYSFLIFNTKGLLIDSKYIVIQPGHNGINIYVKIYHGIGNDLIATNDTIHIVVFRKFNQLTTESISRTITANTDMVFTPSQLSPISQLNHIGCFHIAYKPNSIDLRSIPVNPNSYIAENSDRQDLVIRVTNSALDGKQLFITSRLKYYELEFSYENVQLDGHEKLVEFTNIRGNLNFNSIQSNKTLYGIKNIPLESSELGTLHIDRHDDVLVFINGFKLRYDIDFEVILASSDTPAYIRLAKGIPLDYDGHIRIMIPGSRSRITYNKLLPSVNPNGIVTFNMFVGHILDKNAFVFNNGRFLNNKGVHPITDKTYSFSNLKSTNNLEVWFDAVYTKELEAVIDRYRSHGTTQSNIIAVIPNGEQNAVDNHLINNPNPPILDPDYDTDDYDSSVEDWSDDTSTTGNTATSTTLRWIRDETNVLQNPIVNDIKLINGAFVGGNLVINDADWPTYPENILLDSNGYTNMIKNHLFDCN